MSGSIETSNSAVAKAATRALNRFITESEGLKGDAFVGCLIQAIVDGMLTVDATARGEEREACARLVDTWTYVENFRPYPVAAAIRERGT